MKIENVTAKIVTTRAVYERAMITVRDGIAHIRYRPAKFLDRKSSIFTIDKLKVDHVPVKRVLKIISYLN